MEGRREEEKVGVIGMEGRREEMRERAVRASGWEEGGGRGRNVEEGGRKKGITTQLCTCTHTCQNQKYALKYNYTIVSVCHAYEHVQ